MKHKRTYLTIAIVLLALQTYGQAVPPPIPPPPPPGLPIDGGVLFLLLAGLVYGVKKIRSKN
ncbi:MAG: hypothetical protein JKY44_04745 [Flavobacteriaceae bacterium]|nr:hypothetical protein [Flavobacteriaceae bacterium]